MFADREAPVERAGAVFEHGATLAGDRGLEVRLVLFRCEDGPFEEGDDLVKHGGIARRLEVLGDGVGQPDRVIGDPGAHSPAGRGMPPVLHVAFHELAAGGPEEMLPHDLPVRNG